MTFPASLDISRGIASGMSVYNLFGANEVVGSTYEPITNNAIWRSPPPSGATRLRIRAGGNAADTADGLGARAIQITGLDASGYMQREIVATAGASASEYTTGYFIRVFNVVVTLSGTYGSQTAASHYGDIVIEDESADEWAAINVNGFNPGSTSIGVFTIPKGFNAYVSDITAAVGGVKTANILYLMRQNILNETDMSPVIRIQEHFGITGVFQIDLDPPLKFPELTDIGVMASSTVSASVSFGARFILERIE